MTEEHMTTKTDEALREAIARIIDPSSWATLDSYLADVKRKYRGQDAAYDPEAFKDRKSLAKADAILALSPPPGALREAIEYSRKLTEVPNGTFASDVDRLRFLASELQHQAQDFLPSQAGYGSRMVDAACIVRICDFVAALGSPK